MVEYDGADYAGFQWQSGAPTIQSELEKAIGKLTGEAVRVGGASRTDAGAHSRGQVVHFDTASSYDPPVFQSALNHYLPPAVRIQKVAQVPNEFNARRSAARRRYRYSISNRPTKSPLLRRTHHWVREPLDTRAIRLACASLLGIRDFRRIATGHPKDRSTVRWVYKWELNADTADPDGIYIDCEANGFLRHQIRRINAVLVEIGKGRQPIHAMADALAGRFSSNRQIPTLPAHGLCLMSVHYPEYDHMLKVTSHHETH